MKVWVVVASFLLVALAGCASDGGGLAGGEDSNTGGEGVSGDGGILIAAPADPKVGTTWRFQVEYDGDSTYHVEQLMSKGSEDGYEVAYYEQVESDEPSSVEKRQTLVVSTGAIKESYVATQGLETTTTFDPPCEHIQYPIKAGQDYEVTCTGESSFQTYLGPASQSHTATTRVVVLGTEKKTTALGTFETVHLQVYSQAENGGLRSDEWHLLNGCGALYVLNHGYDSPDSTSELTATTCS